MNSFNPYKNPIGQVPELPTLEMQKQKPQQLICCYETSRKTNLDQVDRKGADPSEVFVGRAKN